SAAVVTGGRCNQAVGALTEPNPILPSASTTKTLPARPLEISRIFSFAFIEAIDVPFLLQPSILTAAASSCGSVTVKIPLKTKPVFEDDPVVPRPIPETTSPPQFGSSILKCPYT